MEIKDFNIKNFQEFDELAYKAVFERGMVDTEFDRQNWNIHLKNLVSLNSNIVRCVYDKDTMVGFYILQLHNLPWNHRTQGQFTLIHLQPNYRSTNIWLALFRDAKALAQANNCEKIQTTDQSIQCDNTAKMEILNSQNFNQIDFVWELKISE